MTEAVKEQLKSLKEFLDLVNQSVANSNEMNGYARAFYGKAYDLNNDETIVDIESKTIMIRLKLKWVQLGMLCELESEGNDIKEASKEKIKKGFLEVAEQCYIYTFNKYK